MSRPIAVDSLVEGHATSEGTERFAGRFAKSRSAKFYRPLVHGPLASSLGIGTYLGDCDDTEDSRYTTAVLAAFDRGVNLLDTAINYRCQRSERAIGEAIRVATEKERIRREEFIVCTKGGYIPLDRTPPVTKEGYRGFLQSEYYGPGIMRPDDVVSAGHCLKPRYLADQIERSRRNLGVASIDVYYLHNPEQQLDSVARDAFADGMRDAFREMEEQVSRGTICTYGCATWNGFRVDAGSRGHLELEELVSIAREVGGPDHHFKVVQLPVNLAMTEAVRNATQTLGGRRVSLLEAAHELGISVIGSATLMQAQLAHSLPGQIRSAFPGFRTDARRAVAFAQSLPLVSSLVGMKSVAHLDENLERGKIS